MSELEHASPESNPSGGSGANRPDRGRKAGSPAAPAASESGLPTPARARSRKPEAAASTPAALTPAGGRAAPVRPPRRIAPKVPAAQPGKELIRPAPRPELDRPSAPASPAAAAPAGRAWDRVHGALWKSGILNVLTLARRELAAYLVSPIGYVVATVLIIPVSLFAFVSPLTSRLPINMADAYSLLIYLLVFFAPLNTMRLLAEESRSGTLELLLTSPARDWEVVAGKWLGAFTYFVLTSLFLAMYVLLLAHFAQAQSDVTILGRHLSVPNLEYGAIFSGYLGVLFVGAAFAAVGLLASSLSQNQVVAAVLALGILVFLVYAVGFLSSFLIQPYADLLDYVSAYNRYQSFLQGQLTLRDVAYFVSLTLAALFLTVRVIESRKWR